MTGGGVMKITSPEFGSMEEIPTKFTCDGKGISPALDIAEVPEGAESLVLILDDPDAPRGTFVHWVVFNIDPTTEAIPEGDAPADAVEAANSAGKRGYVPPCPPSGTHRYFFKLFALDTAVEFITADQLLHRVKEHVIEESELVAVYTHK
jgi:Raf kinase inhibitor-like YbhB/YbcL family protein